MHIFKNGFLSFLGMFDPNRMYLQKPQVIEINGLAKIITDINGNEFNADDYQPRHEITISQPHVVGEGMRVIDYEAMPVLDSSGLNYWIEVRVRRWVPDKEISICGRWNVEKGEPLPKPEEKSDLSKTA